MTVSEAIAKLTKVVEQAPPKLLAFSDSQASQAPTGMSWSRKQILGHLIDSASNNHQRFVRGQFQREMTFPRYVQDEWVAAQGCDERAWTDLVELWRHYNLHLIHVMKRFPSSALGNVCTVAENEPGTMEGHLVDYVVHLEHHLEQILR